MGETNHDFNVKKYDPLKGVEVAFVNEIIVDMCILTSTTSFNFRNIF